MSNAKLQSIHDLEKNKFVSTGPAIDEIAIKVTNPDGSTISGGGSSNPFAPPFGTLSFTVTYPTTVQTIYKFWDGLGGTGTLLQTVTLNFAAVQTPDLTGGDIT